MKRGIGRVAAVATVMVALVIAAGISARAGETPAKFKVGDTAPDFTLQTIEGKNVQLSKVTGSKVVLLAFWSLRCGSCLGEIPYLNRIHGAWKDRGVAVLSVVTDGVDAAATKAIMKETGAAPDYQVLVDPEFTASDTYTSFVVPHTLVIDRKGIIRFVHTGFEPGTEKQYEAALAQALGS